ncbi:MAG: hypothetical protein A2888_00070 [Chlamydiae bacterium RIFCSPLOWO2_01_FULL_28_7]|nr:MAG: hypothetical protein A2888_00070 [Chlamydiae bacterium RIFCSPLOWO2_01_FULL_28_7]
MQKKKNTSITSLFSKKISKTQDISNKNTLFASIFCNGELKIPKNELKKIVAQSKLIIAADGGIKHLKKINIKPDLLIGDNDSLPLLCDISNLKSSIYPKEKDISDGEIAIKQAFKWGLKKFFYLVP